MSTEQRKPVGEGEGEGKGPGDSFQRGERMMGKVALCLRLPECNLNRLGVAKEEGT